MAIRRYNAIIEVIVHGIVCQHCWSAEKCFRNST